MISAALLALLSVLALLAPPRPSGPGCHVRRVSSLPLPAGRFPALGVQRRAGRRPPPHTGALACPPLMAGLRLRIWVGRGASDAHRTAPLRLPPRPHTLGDHLPLHGPGRLHLELPRARMGHGPSRRRWIHGFLPEPYPDRHPPRRRPLRPRSRPGPASLRRQAPTSPSSSPAAARRVLPNNRGELLLARPGHRGLQGVGLYPDPQFAPPPRRPAAAAGRRTLQPPALLPALGAASSVGV